MKLSAGSVISFSAGTASIDATRYRILQNTPLQHKFMLLSEYIQPEQTPCVINAYPATIGTLSFAVFSDSYMNVQTVLRTLQVCTEQRLFPVIITYPLFALHIVLEAQKKAIQIPNNVLFLLGGYTTPLSLELAIADIHTAIQSNASFAYLYGIAEVESAIFIGTRNSDISNIDYKLASTSTQVSCNTLQKLIFTANEEQFITDDIGICTNGIWHITQSPTRTSNSVLLSLEQWTLSDWKRRTGYLYKHNGRVVYQLREDIQCSAINEVDYYDFMRLAKTTWLSKPDWA